jgi:predicted CXXCH cytochrome family protein
MVAATVTALLGSPAVVADILGSKHDLGAGGTAQATTQATTEVCVFCHTPHGARTDVSAPLWNKTLPTTTYQRYSDLGTATLDGTEVTVGSVSLACLSCHDGTQAMDIVINAPGSGNYNAAGAEIDAAAIGVMTNAGTDPIPSLGSDLRDDHPISIEYAGGACTGVNADCDPGQQATGDGDFQPAQFELINTNNQWWVDVDTFFTDDAGTVGTGTPNVREKTDMILYTRNFEGQDGPSVECGSCHDPHEATERPVSFLRISNRDSGVCLACHIK